MSKSSSEQMNSKHGNRPMQMFAGSGKERSVFILFTNSNRISQANDFSQLWETFNFHKGITPYGTIQYSTEASMISS